MWDISRHISASFCHISSGLCRTGVEQARNFGRRTGHSSVRKFGVYLDERVCVCEGLERSGREELKKMTRLIGTQRTKFMGTLNLKILSRFDGLGYTVHHTALALEYGGMSDCGIRHTALEYGDYCIVCQWEQNTAYAQWHSVMAPTVCSVCCVLENLNQASNW